ncbi:MAG TPA: hypothetical protein VE999_02520 [Gemmataceae bacterium]|nr:hypothetical protein [Gemmataceae bacterium]
MSRLTKWFRSPARPARRQRVRLELEQLEQRDVPTVAFLPHNPAPMVTDKGGDYLNSPPVYLIFWGKEWNGGANPMVNDIENATANALASPYLSRLTQYGSDGHAYFAGAVFDNSPVNMGFSGDDIENKVQNAIDNLGLPESDDGPNWPIYLVLTPPGYASNKAASGFHGMTHDSDIGDYDDIPYGWVGWSAPKNGEATLVDGYTSTLSHEVAETMTDTDPGNNPRIIINNDPTQEIGDGEPGGHTYGYREPNGAWVQPYWSQQDGTFIVPDGNLSMFYLKGNYDSSNNFQGNYSLIVNGDQFGPTDDTITVSQITSAPNQGGVQVTLDGDTVQFEAGQLTQIQINTGSGNDTVNVESLPSGVPVFINKAGDGLGFVNVGRLAGNLSTVQSRVDVMASNLAAITVNAYDQNDSNAETYQVDPAYISWGGSGSITYYGGTPGSLALNAGSGADTIKVADLGQSLDHFHTVTIDGGWNSDLTVNDQQASTSETYTLAADHLTRGTGAQQVTVNYSRLKSLTLNTAWWASTVNIDGTPASTTVVGGGHADQFNVNSLDGLGSGLTLDGGSGGATVVLNDSGHVNPYDLLLNYSVTGSSVQRSEMYWDPSTGFDFSSLVTVNYARVNHLELDGSTWFPAIVSVESTSAPTDIHGGSQILVTPTSQTLNSINGLLSIYGGYLTVDDLANPYWRGSGATVSYAVDSVGLSRSVSFLGRPPAVTTDIQGIGLSGLTLDTCIASNKVVVGGTPAPTIINCGAADAVLVGNFLGTIGSLTVNGHGGTLTLDDSATANSDGPIGGLDGTQSFTVGYTVTNQSVGYYAHEVERVYYEPPDGGPGKWIRTTANFASGFHYANVRALTIDSGPIDNSFGVRSTPAGMTLTINGSTGQEVNGADTFNHFTVGDSGSVKNIRSHLVLNGSGPADTVLLDDSAATTQDIVTVTPTQVGMGAQDKFFGAGGGLIYNGISALTLNLSAARDDEVHLTPSAGTAFVLKANESEWQAGHGAILDLDPADVPYATKHQTSLDAGYLTFSNGKKSVTYSGFAQD